jgi:hypothetical protein
MKPISLQDYAKKLGFNENQYFTLQEIQEHCEEHLDWTIWDYPLEELEYCQEEDKNVILVETDFGLRLCEI